MDTQELKKNFDDQIAKTDQQIRELEDNLVKAKEYKLKLEGGLETLALLGPTAEICSTAFCRCQGRPRNGPPSRWLQRATCP